MHTSTKAKPIRLKPAQPIDQTLDLSNDECNCTGNKEGELALLLLRVYRSLHALYGGDHVLMRHWMEQPNHSFGEQPPRRLLPRIEGLTRVANYLDALRG